MNDDSMKQPAPPAPPPHCMLLSALPMRDLPLHARTQVPVPDRTNAWLLPASAVHSAANSITGYASMGGFAAAANLAAPGSAGNSAPANAVFPQQQQQQQQLGPQQLHSSPLSPLLPTLASVTAGQQAGAASGSGPALLPYGHVGRCVATSSPLCAARPGPLWPCLRAVCVACKPLLCTLPRP